MKITPNEKSLLEVIVKSEFIDDDTPVGHEVWTDCVTEDLMTKAGISATSVPGVFSSASQKGLINVENGNRNKSENTVSITQEGYEAYIASQY